MSKMSDLPPQPPTRTPQMWFVAPYMDLSGLEVCSSEEQALEVARLLANKVRGEVWVYAAEAHDKAVPIEATIQPVVSG